MECEINWGDVATWFTGIITLGLFIIGFMQIRNERLLRLKRDINLELRSKLEQAEKISVWIIDDSYNGLLIAVLNQSQQPVYKVIVTVVSLGNEGHLMGNTSNHLCIAVAPPGRGYAKVDADVYGMHHRPGVEIAFTDSSGNNWIRKSNGELIEIEKSSIDYYNIVLPTYWINLMTELPVE